jgi:hypothetical protein
MRSDFLTCAAVVLLAAACSAPASDETAGSTSQALNATPPYYPNGPYGLAVGSVVEDRTYSGKRDANGNGVIDAADPVVSIAMHDYMRHGSTKTRVLILSACAVWCGPCNGEQPQLAAMAYDYAASAPGEVQFISAMEENQNFQPPLPQTLDAWARRYGVGYDMIMDPNLSILGFSNNAGFPTHVIVNTKGMTVEKVVVGANLDDVRAAIDAVLAEPPGNSGP